jgi:uncharacterized protein
MLDVHPALVRRLTRAEGNLRHAIAMVEQGRPCTDITTQLHALERAVTAAKRMLIHDHIDHCLGDGGAGDVAEMRALTKLL